MWYDRQEHRWDRMSDDQLIRRLTLPGGRLDMVLDTDTYNEVDDQFALCYALLSPERLNVQAVYAAPYFNDRSTGLPERSAMGAHEADAQPAGDRRLPLGPR